MSIVFPFTAIVGQERLQLALTLSALSPEIGGVLIRGEKGTAKTTTVRALAPLLDGALVNLPLGATEDRVVGSIDISTVLTTGETSFHPGLMSAANGGILYVDEVNLLPDHLVDVLLDTAATGRITVERDGISHSENSRFVLVGTMNPEEGELRPQLLDRFGLTVDVTASRQPHVRAEIIARRLAFDADSAGFAQRFAESTNAYRRRLDRAYELLPQVALTPITLGRIATICADFDVAGMRADIVIARTAAAHAAWRVAQQENCPDCIEIGDEDIKVAAELALPHRRRRDPFDEPGLDNEALDNALDHANDEFPDDSSAPTQDSDSAADSVPEGGTDGIESSEAPAPAQGGSATIGAPFRRC